MNDQPRLLIVDPPSRINDQFCIRNNPAIDFSFNYINRDTIIEGTPNQESSRYSADFYDKIGVDIVAETVFNYPYQFITEKTFRSIACLRPFIIVGPYKILEFTRSFEFKTFSAIIDETYDNIQDPEKRFLSVCNSIKNFVSRPVDQIRNDLISIEDVLLHNRKILTDLYDNQLKKFKINLNDL
jgi:hypothetical protein